MNKQTTAPTNTAPRTTGASEDSNIPTSAIFTNRSIVVDGLAILTPDLYREIDDAGKRMAGKPFYIYRREDSPLWGKCEIMCNAVVRDLRELKSAPGDAYVFAELSLLGIANEVMVDEFHNANRPEIDLSKVPTDRIHEFVAYHEIGHVLDNYGGSAVFRLDPEIGRTFRLVNEVLADRFAWRTMFPQEPMPIRDGCEGIADAMGEWEALLMAAGVSRLGPPKLRDLDALEYVPIDHVEQGVPFSRKLGPLVPAQEWLRAIKRAKRDLERWRMRGFRETAREMAEVWADIARKPDALAMNLYHERRPMTEWKRHHALKQARASA